MAYFPQELTYHNKCGKDSLSILYLNYSMEVGGIEILISEFARRLNGNDFIPSVCVLKGGGSLGKNLKSEGVSVYSIEKREGLDFTVIPRLRSLLLKEGIKILHTHNYSSWFYGVLAARGIKGLRHIHTVHSNVDKKRRAWMERILGRFTDIIVCVSENVRKSMMEGQGIPPERLTVIYNGVDTGSFRPDQDRRKIYRDKLCLRHDSPVIGIVARLTPVKDHLTLLEAFLDVSKNIPDAVLIIVGDGELRDELERRASRPGLKGRVLFLGERKDIPGLLNAMDIFVLSSVSEGHNVALLEAMAASLPVVATNVGGNREIVLDEVTGHLVPSENPEILAEKIIQIIKGKDSTVKMGEKARERAQTLFSIEKMINEYRKLYLSLNEKT